MKAWQTLFQTHWEAWFGEPPPAGFSLAQREKLLFVFPQGEAHPRLFVKIARDEWGGAKLQRAWRTLSALHSQFPHIARSVPRPLLLTQWGARPALVATALDGIPWLSLFLHRDPRRAEPLSSALAWLRDFQVATCHREIPDPHYLEQMTQQWRHLPLKTDAQRLIAIIHALWERAAASCETFPCVWYQGDLQVANLFLSTQLKVIDWEQSGFHRLPHFDLMYFLTSFHSLDVSCPVHQAWWELFVEKPPWVRRVLTNWALHLEVPTELLPVLLSLFLLEWVDVELDFFQRDYRRGYLGGDDTPEQTLGSVQTLQRVAARVNSEGELLQLLGGW